jgi:carboxymethylenebutenolidase
MCFDLDSSPPIPIIAGAAVEHRDLVLDAADGNRFSAFAAFPDEPKGIGIVVLPDVRGLYRFYEELALRFAERAYTAVAIDYFGRSLGVGKRENDWDYMPEVQKLTYEGIQADVGAAVAYLRSPEGGACESIFTVGFCFGGSASWNAAAAGHGLAGAVGFYGRPSRVEDVAGIEAPILALQAGADAHITADDNSAFDHELAEAGVEHEVRSYEGAPHSFFDRKQEEFAVASADAWERTLAFVDRHSAPAVSSQSLR